jgi:addiction module RelB/DinJ family antitoxin
MKTQVNLKIDMDVKMKAQKRASDLGLSLSSVVNATLKQFAKTGELHLSSRHKATPYLERIALEAQQDRAEGKTSGPFDTADDLMRHLNTGKR